MISTYFYFYRELEKQARFYKAALKNCEDSMQTGYETESSSDDECYVNSTNLGGPKRRRYVHVLRRGVGREHVQTMCLG